MVRVLIVDDHPVARAGIRMALEEAGFEVVGEAEDGHTAVSLMRTLRPQVAVVDLALPGISGLEVVRRARALGIPAVVLSMYDEEPLRAEAARAGAAAYVSKGGDPRELIAAVARAAAGKRDLRGDTEPLPLSPRELEVVRLLGEGKKLSEVARILCRSRATVRAQKASAMRKLGAHSTQELLRRAQELGLIP